MLLAVLLFWNVRRSPVEVMLAQICAEHDVDIVILAEAEMRTVQLLDQFNGHGGAPFWEFRPVPSRLRLLTRYPPSCISVVFDDGHVSMRNFRPSAGAELLIVAAHLPSKLHSDDQDQYYRIRQLREHIARAEGQVGHRNSIVIGDLNANPFEEAMVAADGLHGVMDKITAQRPSRTVNGREWDFFYNPMWSRLGDESKGPPGTYYYARGSLVSYFWNTFDQVLLRPSLIPYYDAEGLAIVTHIGGKQILNPGRAGKDAPDHLPLVVRLSVEMERSNG
jgi:Endonuclease/Exonuclease/phosphatase family